MLRTAIIAAVLATVVALVGASASGAASRPTYLPSMCTDQVIRPVQVVPCAQTTRKLIGLRWSNWGRARATARGSLTTNTCVPDCPSGASRIDPVRVTADRVRRCRNGRRQYTRLTYVSVDPGAIPTRRISLRCRS